MAWNTRARAIVDVVSTLAFTDIHVATRPRTRLAAGLRHGTRRLRTARSARRSLRSRRDRTPIQRRRALDVPRQRRLSLAARMAGDARGDARRRRRHHRSRDARRRARARVARRNPRRARRGQARGADGHRNAPLRDAARSFPLPARERRDVEPVGRQFQRDDKQAGTDQPLRAVGGRRYRRRRACSKRSVCAC